MGANMRNTIRTSDDDLIVATKVTTDALASATNDLPPSLGSGSGWAGILKGILAHQPVTNADHSDDGFFSHSPVIVRIDETRTTIPATSAANTTENSASGIFNDKFTAGSSIEIQGITATYGRMVVPLTSRGEAVTLINETQNDGSTLVTGMAGGREIFRLIFNTDGSYTFSQLGSLDHVKPDEPDDALNLFFSFTVDGKQPDAIMIQVHDDAPVFHRADSTIIADETSETVVTGDIPLNFGTDGPAAANNAPVTITGFHGEVAGTLFALKSHGVAVTMQTVDGEPGTIEGWADGVHVFTLKTDSYGQDIFTLLAPLDHPDDTNPDDPLRIVFDLVIKDFDSDQSAAQTSVTIRDDGPAINEAVSYDSGIYEQDGIAQHQPVTGEFIHQFGFDGQANGREGIVITNAQILWGENQQAALTAGGIEITFVRDVSDGNVFHGMAGDKEIFTLTFNSQDQSFTYTQLSGIDHPDANASAETIDLRFDIDLIDADGDKVSSSLTIADIHDSAPVAMHDTDLVYEGGTTTGNLVTGIDPDNSSKLTGDLSRDSMGSDAVVMRSVTHSGVTYTLSADQTEVTASDGGQSILGFDPETGVLTLSSGLGGVFSIDMSGSDVGAYSYEAPDEISTDNSVQIDLDYPMPEGGYLLNFGGRIAESVQLYYQGTPTGTPDITTYRFGHIVDDLLSGTNPLLITTTDSAGSGDAYQVGDLSFQLTDQSFYGLSNGGYTWTGQYAESWNKSFSFGDITGEVYTIGDYTIDLGPFGSIYVPPVTIDTRFGFEGTLGSSGKVGVEFGFDYNDYAYDADFTMTANITPPSTVEDTGYYAFNGSSLINTQAVSLDSASWEAWMKLLLDVDVFGSYEARIPYYGISDSFNWSVVDWSPTLVSVGMDDTSFLHASLFGYEILSGLGDPDGGSGLLPDQGTYQISYDPDNLTSIERIELDLPEAFSSGTDAVIGGIPVKMFPDLGVLSIYNLSDLMQEQTSTESNGVITVSGDVNVLGLAADLDALIAASVGMYSGFFGGSIGFGPLKLDYDLIDVDLGPVFGIQQELQLTPELLVDLNFSQEVWVEGYNEPLRSLECVSWTNLPGIKPVGEDPVTVTPTFYLGGMATATSNALLSLNISIDVAEFDLKIKLAPAISIPIVGIGPLFTLDKQLGEWTLGEIFGTDYDLSDEAIYNGLASFAFPLAANPFPSTGMDMINITDDDAIDHVVVNFAADSLSKEFFSYVLEDADGDQSGANFAVTIAAPLPDDISLSSAVIDENSAIGTVIGAFTAYSDGTSLNDLYGNAGQFALINNPGGLFAINAAGQLVVNANLDYETNATPAVTVQITDRDGQTYDETFTITVNDVNDLPVLPDASFSVDENAAGTILLGSITATDQDGDHVSLSLTTGGDIFSLSDDGQLSLTTTTGFDYETQSSYQITVAAEDEHGGVSSRDYTINILDMNEPPTALTLSNNVIFENIPPISEIVGTLSVTDPDANETFTYQVSNDKFEISGNQLRVKEGAIFTAGTDETINITVTDHAGLSFSQTFTIVVNNANDQPTEIKLEGSSIDENSAANTLIGTLSIVDPDQDIGSFTLLNAANLPFVLVGNELRVASGADLNYEKLSTYPITVLATDVGGYEISQNFTISVNDRNDAPATAPDIVLTTQDSGTLLIPEQALLYNDTDEDNDILTILPASVSENVTFNTDTSTLAVALGDDFAETPTELTFSVSDGIIAADSWARIEQVAVTGEHPLIQGTTQSEVLIGTSADEQLMGNGGNDVLIGAGGDDALDAGAGNDLLLISDTDFASANGGEGLDTLGLLSSGMTIDLTALDSLSNIEAIDMNGAGDNTLVVNPTTVLDLSDLLTTGSQSESIHWLIVNGDAYAEENGISSGDTVQLLSDDWSQTADTAVNGINYEVYVATIDATTSVGVMIEEDLRLQQTA